MKTKRKEVTRIPLSPDEQFLCKSTGDVPKMSEITWRIFRIMAEFVEGFQFLSKLDKEITVFGSARLDPNTRWYQEAVDLGTLLAKNGFTVVTGGGPGIMEAANRGAYEAKGRSVGINIQLPNEQRINPFVTLSRGFHYFFTRKVILAASAQAYIYFPGGYGTMDEFFEILTLIQTGKSEKIPIVLMGTAYWQGLVDWLRDVQLKEFQTISESDLELFHIVDTAQDAFEAIRHSKERTFF